MTKVLTVLGTRPEIIRLSRLLPELDRTFEHVLVHTGQNYDPNLSQVFFDELELRTPDRYLDVDTSSLGRFLGNTLIQMEEVLHAERPDAVVILGDTNSSIAAVMAKRLRVPIYHLEAGNRCFDENVPEETNRRLIDHVSDFNLAYTEQARRNLLAEGLPSRRVVVTGTPMREVLEHYRPRIDASSVLGRLGLEAGRYLLVSAHREENVEDPQRLGRLLDCLTRVQQEWGLPVVVSTHPRTRLRLEARLGADQLRGVRFHPPFGFLDYNHLQLRALCVLSDSGTISEESAILGFAAVTLRESIERPEAWDAGGIVTTGLSADAVIAAVHQVVRSPRLEVPEYADAAFSHRVSRFVQSTVRSSAEWYGLRRSPWP